MARKLRVEYAGAIYHVMNRGDRREPIFEDDQDRQRFLTTLGEACVKTGWQVHALCLMPNHFHLVVETPQPNLVAGVKWFLGTYTSRFNRRHKVFGHLFSGRYKALIVDGSGNGYLKTVCDYVHLNPARAKLLSAGQPLSEYRWSSWPEYLKSPGKRPAWLRVDRLLGEYRIPQDSAAGRRHLAEVLEQRRKAEQSEEFKAIRRGWFFGNDVLKQELLAQVSEKSGQSHYGELVQESAVAAADRVVTEELMKRKWAEQTLATRRKGDPVKVVIAQRLQRETTMTLAWIAERLRMGTKTYLAHLLYWKRRNENSTKLVTDPKAIFCAVLLGCQAVASAASYLSPAALAATPDGKTLFVTCLTANRVDILDTASRKIVNAIPVPQPPTGLVLSPEGTRLYVTCAAPESKICIVDLKKEKVIGTLPAGHSATAPVLSVDGKTLYVCNQFNNDVGVIDLATKKEVCRIPVQREPVAADITKNGKFLLVANQLPTGRADVETVAAVVSVIDLSVRKAVKELQLPNGSGSLKDIRVSPDGKYAVVTHLVSSFNRLTTKVQFGWMNANAMTIIDLAPMRIRSTVLLDEPNRGAANPWGAAWSADGQWLAVAHAGTHEVSLINFPVLLANLPDASGKYPKRGKSVLTYISHYEGFDPGSPFLTGARERIKLPEGDRGPRALTFENGKIYVANYFSDTLSVIDLESPEHKAESIPLGPKTEMDTVRKGEFYFHDATICLQGWQSCSSCHPGDARVDGFNWDLLNDGIGNPKNVRSLLLAHKTPPAMFLGVRTNAETAVRAGIKFILFTKQPEAVPTALDEYLKSLKPVPSPYLVHGSLSPAAKRGEKIFQGAGCAECHVPGLFTDLHPHDVGTRRTFDGPTDKFYPPTLIEVWRTAPYLHDGSAATIRDVLTTRNSEGEHGDVAGLSEPEIDDLCEYVLSL